MNVVNEEDADARRVLKELVSAQRNGGREEMLKAAEVREGDTCQEHRKFRHQLPTSCQKRSNKVSAC